MAIKMPSQAEIDRKYKESIGRVPSAYKDGVQKTTDWAEKASSDQAEQNYAAGVQEAAAAKRRQKAVSNVSNSEWQGKAANVGAARIGQGMTANADKRARNFEPFRSALDGKELSARTTDPIQNVERVKEVVQTLVNTKKALKG